jgi:hypothetical protein
MKLRVSLAVLAFLLFAGSSQAILAQKQVKIRFANGKSEGIYNGVIKGYTYIDYKFKAKSGQKLSVLISTKTFATVFDIFSNSESLISDQDTESAARVEIHKTDSYTIRIRLMASQARRNAVSKFKLKLSIK